MRVTTAEFIKNYGTLADRAFTEPVTITKNGRDRLVVMSADEYTRLVRRDRRAVRPEDLSEEVLAAIAAAGSGAADAAGTGAAATGPERGAGRLEGCVDGRRLVQLAGDRRVLGGVERVGIAIAVPTDGVEGMVLQDVGGVAAAVRHADLVLAAARDGFA